jgi:hypothetical protein
MARESTISWPTASRLKVQFLEDIELQCIDAGIAAPPMGRGTHWDLEATAVSNAVAILSANQQILDSDSNPLTATGNLLDEWRERLALPVVAASGGQGRLTVRCAGVGSIPSGLRFVSPAGLRGQTVTGYTTTTGSQYVDVEMSDTGAASNLTEGTIVRWEGPPPNLFTEAVVTADFQGGTSVESDDRKRARILNRLANPPGGGNWSQVREISMNASGAVGGCYVYPALGGPGSMLVVVVSGTSALDRQLVSRSAVETAIAAEFPPEMWKIAIRTVTNQNADVALYADGPQWQASGPVNPSRVTVSSSGTGFVLTPLTGTAAGAAVGEKIAYWSAADGCFYTATVLTSSVVGTQSLLTTSAWSGGGAGPALNEYVCPAFVDIEAFGAAYLAIMLSMGPGEMLLSTDPRYLDTKRQPNVSGLYPSALTSRQLSDLQAQFDDIIDLSYALTPPTTGTPATIADSPYCLVPRHFGVYPTP